MTTLPCYKQVCFAKHRTNIFLPVVTLSPNKNLCDTLGLISKPINVKILSMNVFPWISMIVKACKLD